MLNICFNLIRVLARWNIIEGSQAEKINKRHVQIQFRSTYAGKKIQQRIEPQNQFSLVLVNFAIWLWLNVLLLSALFVLNPFILQKSTRVI